MIKTDEKGSDVNLATFMLLDAVDAITSSPMISNASDLLLPIEVVSKRLGLTVGVLNPNQRNPSVVLQRDACPSIRLAVDIQFRTDAGCPFAHDGYA